MIIFKSFEQVDRYLTELGFSRYYKNAIHKEECGWYQKRYVDEKGKKYFIDCDVYDWRWTSRVLYNFSVEFNGQFYQRDTHDAMNINFLGWELDKVEAFLDSMFENGMLDYYEEWE